MSTTAQRPRWLESRGVDADKNWAQRLISALEVIRMERRSRCRRRLIPTRENLYFYKSPKVELGGIEPPSISP